MTPIPWLLTIVMVFGSLLSIVLILLLMWNDKKKREHELALAQVGGASKQKIRVAQMIREKETIVKEVVMIPCKYCGGLMPQTSIFCPNCGARKTSA